MKLIKSMNLYIKKNIIIIISFLIVLQPIIDLIIGLSIRTNFLILYVSLIRIIILILLLYYIVFINNTKSKNILMLLLAMIGLYMIAYCINMNFSFIELTRMLKTFYFPVLLIVFFGIFEEKDTTFDKKYLLVSLLIYSIIIILGYISKTGFSSYTIAKSGTTGYFYAANEVGGIIAVILPFVFMYVFNKINITKILYFLCIVLAILIIGTKTPFISFVLCSAYFIIKAVKKENILKVLAFNLIILVFMSITITKTPIYKNLIIHAEYLEISNFTEILTTPKLFDQFFLGSRLKLLNNNNNYYMQTSLNNKLLGIGYNKNKQLVEMDFFDIFYRQGIIGLLLYITIITSLFILKPIRYEKDNLLSIILIVLIASIVGHIIMAPSVSTFICYILYSDKNKVV